EDIGALVVPIPTARQLADTVQRHYGFLAELSADEEIIARADERDRSLVIALLRALPTLRFENLVLR
ncbi:MAG: hypothetical protein LBJ48_01575, partial [Coriobacteriales bacterium]|nr:hypothetical protein [Coriobacteriales bacterium]